MAGFLALSRPSLSGMVRVASTRSQQRPAAAAEAQPWGPAAARRRRCLQPGCRRRQRLAAVSGPGSGGAAQPSSSKEELEELLYGDEVPLSRLQLRLDAAVEDEDYELAAQLRDVLQRRRFDVRLAVEEANDRFYVAFQSGNLAAMSEVWGKGEHVQCIHPMGGCIAGRQDVMESWRMILGAGRLRIKLEDVRTFATDSTAVVTCVEVTDSGEGKGRIVATNVFERQGGKWKLVHHHGSPAARVGFR